MPLKKGKSKKTISANISELVKSKPSSARAKGIKTLASRRGISPAKAKQKQAVAIALSKARKSGAKITTRAGVKKSLRKTMGYGA